MNTPVILPVSHLLERLPAPLLSGIPIEGMDELVGYSSAIVDIQEGGFHFSIDLVVLDEIVLEIPGINVLAFQLSTPSSLAPILAKGHVYTDLLTLVYRFQVKFQISLLIDTEVLRPIDPVSNLPEEEADFLRIELGSAGVEFDSKTKPSFDFTTSFSIPLCMIGDTGILIRSDNVRYFNSTSQASQDLQLDGFEGLFIEEAEVLLPNYFASLLPNQLTIKNCTIGSNGFSGALELDWNPAFQGVFLGFKFQLISLAIGFLENSLTEFSIKGQVEIPFFEKSVLIEINLDQDGDILIGIANDSGLQTIETDIFDFEIISIAFEIEDGVFKTILSGKIIPTIDILGGDWPSIEIPKLTIDSQGNISLEGGWLDLPRQFSKELFGFKFEITKFGMGKSDDGGKWIGFSGGIQLVDGITAGGSVEGLRFTWYDNGDSNISFNGLGVEFEVPGALYFKGEVDLNDSEEGGKEFRGDISLKLIMLNLSIDGELVIGRKDDENYFAIYLDMALPAAIPIGPTGLGLYGISGLYAQQYEPNKSGDMRWYSLDKDRSWYHQGEVGVADLDKWTLKPGSFALGAGVSLGTLGDNGYVLSGSLLFAIVFPGPIIILEGSANLLGDRAGLKEEGKFGAIAVLDFREGDFTFGLDATYKFASKGELIDISAGAEAYFSFHDFWAWHLYIGKRDPIEQRVRAELISIFTANAYLMLEPTQLAFGAWVGYDEEWKFGPLKVELASWMEGNVALSWMPPHVHGDYGVFGEVKASAFGIGIGFSLGILLAADIYDPFHLLAEFTVGIYPPWPAPDIEVTIPLEWGPEPDFPALPHPLKEIAVEHPKVSTTWPLPAKEGLLLPDLNIEGGYLNEVLAASELSNITEGSSPPAIDSIPIIPMDSMPSVTFQRFMNDDAMVGFNVSPSDTKERIGDPNKKRANPADSTDPAPGEGPVSVRYGLQGVALHRWDNKEGWQWVAKKGITQLNDEPSDGNIQTLYGTWAPVPEDDSTNPQTKLLLNSRNPYNYTRFTGRTLDEWASNTLPDYPCPPEPTDRTVCCDFEDWPAGTIIKAPWIKPGLPEISFSTNDGTPLQINGLPYLVEQKGNGLYSPQKEDLIVSFPTPSKRTELLVYFNLDTSAYECVDFSLFPAAIYPSPLRLESCVIETPNASASTSQFDNYPLPVLYLEAGITKIDLHNVSGKLTLLFLAQQEETVIQVDLFDINENPLVYDVVETAHEIPVGGYLQLWSIQLVGEEEKIKSIQINSSGQEVFLAQICHDSFPRIVGVTTNGREINPTSIEWPSVVFSGQALSSIRISGGVDTSLVEVCATFPPSPSAIDGYRSSYDRFQEMVESWSGEGPVLYPNTVYRLAIVTTIDAQGEGELAGSRKRFTLKEFAYFRTDRPPGFTNLSSPLGQEVKSPFAPVIGLDKLDLYVRQTLPPTVIKEGEKPFIPRPVYRAYDTGLEFISGDEVELMYRLDGGGIGFYLFDRNDLPARDFAGHLIIPSNQHGSAAQINLSESELLIYERLNQTDCTTLPPVPFSRSKTMRGFGKRTVLAPDTLYTARLIPLVLFDDFARGLVGWEIHPPSTPWETPTTHSGENAEITANEVKIDLDSQINLGSILPDISVISLFFEEDQLPEKYTIQRIVPPDILITASTFDTSNIVNNGRIRWEIQSFSGLLQKSTYGETVSSPNSVHKPGTLCVKGDDDWTNYRFSVWMRSLAGENAMGVVFRYQSSVAHYRFLLNISEKHRRLEQIVPTSDGTGSRTIVMAENSAIINLNRDYHIVVEVIDDSIKVYQDGRLVFDILDNTYPAGQIGLFCWQNPDTLFREARVDSFMEDAKVLYDFDFTTSYFTNFYHHLHSSQDGTWDYETDHFPVAGAGVAIDSINTPRNSAAIEAEDRAFREMAEATLGANRFKSPERVELIKVVPSLGEKNSFFQALWFRSPEPIDWQRISVQLKHTNRLQPFHVLPQTLKITQVAFNEPTAENSTLNESVTILLNEPYNLSRHRIEFSQFPAGIDPTLANKLLFLDDFNGGPKGVVFSESFEGDLAERYQVINEPFPSGLNWDYDINWHLPAGELYIEQTQRIPPGRIPIDAVFFSTLAINWSKPWHNIHLQTILSSSSDTGGMGLVFGFKDSDHYYEVKLYRYPSALPGYFQEGVIVRRKRNGRWSILWRKSDTYSPNTDYLINVSVYEDTIIGEVAEAGIPAGNARKWKFSIIEDQHIEGMIGFVATRCPNVQFKKLTVTTLENNPLLWAPTLNNLEGFTIKDDPDVLDGPSNWSAQAGMLTQTNPIYIDEGNIWNSLVTTVLSEATFPLNNSIEFNYSINITQDTSGEFGIVFNYQDDNNYSRFSTIVYVLSFGSAHTVALFRRLVQKVDGILQVAWTGYDAHPFQSSDEVILQDEILLRNLNGKTLLLVNDVNRAKLDSPFVSPGKIGFNTVRLSTVEFSNLMVKRSESYVGDWEIVNENVTSQPPGSEWLMKNGALAQLNAYGNLTDEFYEGTFAVNGQTEWQNYRFKAGVFNENQGAVGLVFHLRNYQQYYRFLMDENGARLEQVVNSSVNLLQENNNDNFKYTEFDSAKPFNLMVDIVNGRVNCFVNDSWAFSHPIDPKSRGKVGLYASQAPNVSFDFAEVTMPPIEGYLLATDSGNNNVVFPQEYQDFLLEIPLNSSGVPVIRFRMQDEESYYQLFLFNQGPERYLLNIGKQESTGYKILYENSFQNNLDAVRKLSIRSHQNKIEIFTDDIPLVCITDTSNTPLLSGSISVTGLTGQIRRVDVFSDLVFFRDYLLFEDFSTFIPQRWEFIDAENASSGPSDWRVQNGRLLQSSSINAPENRGTYAVTGDKLWDNYRVFLFVKEGYGELSSGGSIGILFRFQDIDNHYVFSVHRSNTGYSWSFKKTANGNSNPPLSSGSLMRNLLPNALCIDVEEDRFTLYADGKILATVFDPDLPLLNGKVGVFCENNPQAGFDQFIVSPPIWSSYYTFGTEKALSAGTQIKVFSGNQNNIIQAPRPEEVFRYLAIGDQIGTSILPVNGAGLRLVTPDLTVLQERSFIPSASFNQLANSDLNIVRKADNTEFIILKSGETPFSPGNYRLIMSFQRKIKEELIYSEGGSTEAESVVLDVLSAIHYFRIQRTLDNFKRPVNSQEYPCGAWARPTDSPPLSYPINVPQSPDSNKMCWIDYHEDIASNMLTSSQEPLNIDRRVMLTCVADDPMPTATFNYINCNEEGCSIHIQSKVGIRILRLDLGYRLPAGEFFDLRTYQGARLRLKENNTRILFYFYLHSDGDYWSNYVGNQPRTAESSNTSQDIDFPFQSLNPSSGNSSHRPALDRIVAITLWFQTFGGGDELIIDGIEFY